MNKQRRYLLAGLTLLTFSIVTALALRTWLHPPLQLQAAQLLPEAKGIEGQALTVDGTHIDLAVLKGRWLLVFFGYSSCPDVCPLELQKLGQMLKQFDEAGSVKKPLVLFVSLDPERDTAAALKIYTAYFHPDMLGVTGRNTELAALASFFGFSYNRTTQIKGKDYLIEAGADMPEGSGKHYLVNHSSRIFIIDPQSRYVGSFAPPHDAAILFADMQQLVNQ